MACNACMACKRPIFAFKVVSVEPPMPGDDSVFCVIRFKDGVERNTSVGAIAADSTSPAGQAALRRSAKVTTARRRRKRQPEPTTATATTSSSDPAVRRSTEKGSGGGLFSETEGEGEGEGGGEGGADASDSGVLDGGTTAVPAADADADADAGVVTYADATGIGYLARGLRFSFKLFGLLIAVASVGHIIQRYEEGDLPFDDFYNFANNGCDSGGAASDDLYAHS